MFHDINTKNLSALFNPFGMSRYIPLAIICQSEDNL